MRALAGRASLCALLGALVLGAPSAALARKDQAYAYRWEQVWSAAVRMVRVDLRYPIHDQDESIGYLLFEHRERGRASPGSIELVRVRDERRELIKVIVQIPSMPSYVEQMMLDRLGRKLLDEFGEPPPPPRREPTPEPPRDREGQGSRDGGAGG